MSTTSTTSTVTWVTPAACSPPGQPEINYAPDYDNWQARVKRRLAEGNLPGRVPEGFPERLIGDVVWDGATLAETYDWTYVLNDEQLAEIDQAVAHFKSLGRSLGHINAGSFPLPSLHPELRRLSNELHSGHGFFIIRGIKVDEHTREENIIIYTGLSAHIAGERGRQDHKYDGKPADVVLTHIKDLSHTGTSDIGSPAYTTDKQVFHTDSGDIVALFALEIAKKGGASKLTSTWTVYNEIAKTRPDLIHTLSEPWDMEIFEKADKQWMERPLLHLLPATDRDPQRVSLQYGRRYFVGFGALPRSRDIPPITEAQAEALDTLHFIGEKYCVNTEFQKGDIQYINNLSIFHARDGFVNQGEKQRHLLRLWLRDPENAWQTPQVFQPRWDQIYKGVTAENSVFPLEPYIRSAANRGR
ncbi:hypothetical protein LCI18_013955 [Fusarium solani-melongenae]|uniref:Uncharacterized protein n=1 Tax=Fusarium solani subsp. cucurbitae TaxID=2747967 RepID=A0ACD3ZP68_FUSSC|nr:hypothetical protein LCI18_013955 [Fusarium solani-melongenae]